MVDVGSGLSWELRSLGPLGLPKSGRVFWACFPAIGIPGLGRLFVDCFISFSFPHPSSRRIRW